MTTTVKVRTDGLGWDVEVELAEGRHTTRSIIKSDSGFTVVNPFKWPDTARTFTSYADAMFAAENLLV